MTLEYAYTPEEQARNERTIRTFAKRLNVVLRSADWPECEYLGGPDLFAQGKSHCRVTIHHSTFDDLFWLTIERSDRRDVLRVETHADLNAKSIVTKARNDLIRRTRAALS